MTLSVNAPSIGHVCPISSISHQRACPFQLLNTIQSKYLETSLHDDLRASQFPLSNMEEQSNLKLNNPNNIVTNTIFHPHYSLQTGVNSLPFSQPTPIYSALHTLLFSPHQHPSKLHKGQNNTTNKHFFMVRVSGNTWYTEMYFRDPCSVSRFWSV